MAKEIERGYEIGNDAYGRSVTLSRRRDYMGRVVWTIVAHSDSARDEGERINCLSDQNIREIADAVKHAQS